MNFSKHTITYFSCLSFFLIAGCVEAPSSLSIPIKQFTREKNWQNWSLHTATFNVWDLPIIAKNIDERIPAIGTDLKSKKFDFVMLEEAWQTKDQKILVQKSGLNYSKYFSVPRTIGSGLFSLSQTPITRTSFREFILNGHLKDILQADAYSGKGASMTSVVVRGLPVSFFSTHTIARYGEDVNKLEDAHTVDRLLQLFEIFRHIVEQTDSDAFVVAGDFNMRYFHTEYEFWRSLTSLEGIKNEEFNAKFCTYCSDNTYHSNNEGQLDYIFISPRLEIVHSQLDFNQLFKAKSGKMINFSDHYGLSADIIVRSSPASISVEMAKINCLKGLGDLRERLEGHLILLSSEIETEGVEQRICRTCRIKEGLASVLEMQKAINSAKENEGDKIKILRLRLNSYFDLFKD